MPLFCQQLIGRSQSDWMEAKATEVSGRPLEGRGSEARLRRLQKRFAKLNRSIDQARRSKWRFGLLCILTFAGVFTGGLLLLS